MSVCWICHGDEEPLVKHCECTGETGPSHTPCLLRWAREHPRCTFCNTDYKVPPPPLTDILPCMVLWAITFVLLFLPPWYDARAIVKYVAGGVAALCSWFFHDVVAERFPVPHLHDHAFYVFWFVSGFALEPGPILGLLFPDREIRKALVWGSFFAQLNALVLVLCRRKWLLYL